MCRLLFKQGFCRTHIKISVFEEINSLSLFIRQTGHSIIYIIDVDL